MTSPTDRTTPEYRAHIRALAETKRRKRRNIRTPDRRPSIPNQSTNPGTRRTTTVR